MKHIQDPQELEAYYHSFPLTDLFESDIRPYTSVVSFESGEDVLQEGTEPEFLYYLIDGRAKLFLSHENSRVSLISFLNAPCFIGEMELLGAQKEAKGVTAITGCTCFAIRLRDCRELLLQDAVFLRHLCLFLGRKVVGNTSNYSLNQSYPLDVRLANFILMTEQGRVYRERHTETAEFLGVTYRHLLYVLAAFVRRGLLQKTPQGYRIADIDALKRLAAAIRN